MIARIWKSEFIWMVLTVVVVAVYLADFIYVRWIPQDEGTLALSADLFRHGKLPHIDFVDVYTGGLTLLHSWAFALWGVKLSSMRTMLFLAFMLAVPFYYSICRRAVSAQLSSVVTFAAVVWSVPNYAGPMPSWYVLIFSIIGCYLLLRFTETRALRWIFGFGLCAGISTLVKIIGLYQLVAALMFLSFLAAEDMAPGDRRSKRILPILVLGTAPMVALCLLLSPLLNVNIGIHFLVPVLMVWVAIFFSKSQEGILSDEEQPMRKFLMAVAVLSFGFLVPIALGLWPYAVRSAWPALYAGMIELPSRRLKSVAFPLPPIQTMIAVLPVFAAFCWSFMSQRKSLGYFRSVLLLSLCALLVFADDPHIYRSIWYSLRPMLAFLSIIAVWLLVNKSPTGQSERVDRHLLMLMLAVGSFGNLVQFPYAFGVYFYYFAPLLILVALFLLKACQFKLQEMHAMVLLFYTLVAVVWLNSSFVRTVGTQAVPDDWTYRMRSERAGLRVDRGTGEIYDALVSFLIERDHGRHGYIYAGPDSPELYFLSDTKNPQRVALDIFESDSRSAKDRISSYILEFQIETVVVNQSPEFSKPLDEECLKWLQGRFLHSRRFRNFVVFF
jgi:hypothetical protein